MIATKQVLRWLREMECDLDPWVVDGQPVPWVHKCAETAVMRGELSPVIQYCTPDGSHRKSAAIRPTMIEANRELWRRLLVVLSVDPRSLRSIQGADGHKIIGELLDDLNDRLGSTEFVWRVQLRQRARQARLEGRIEATREDKGLAPKTYGTTSRRVGALRHGGAGWVKHTRAEGAGK